MDRRRFLAGAGALGTTALAGCTGGGGGDGASGTPIAGHPAGADLDAQPRLGDAEETVIVAFEDPSCTLCRRFERETYPRIVSDLVEPGTASFVYRGLPIIYPWGDPAAHVLEATFAADADAFWALKDHYYAEQGAFDESNVYERSRAFLDGETSVDADAVVSAAEGGEADAAVQADLDAGGALDVGQTPVFYLFRDGRYETTVRGAQGYSVFATALEG
ncbi:DsbA family protein [Halorarius halobius]|uniref:DsbA family protein n=1 Tax=Halorarius halobius TaxID=2962671 RepID=UPI0020CF8DED|nr:thioredoxin domain-containing protein [Halorarius halobius]